MHQKSVTKAVEIMLILATFIPIFLCGTVFSIANLYFYISIAICVIHFLSEKKITLFIIWLGGFIFIILSEMLLYPEYISDRLSMRACRFLLSANNLVLLGYLINVKHYRTSLHFVSPPTTMRYKYDTLILLMLGIGVCMVLMPLLHETFLHGRQLTDAKGGFQMSDLPSIIADKLSILLPSILAYYLIRIRKLSIWYAIVLAFPFLGMNALLGTRFKFLFAVFPFLILSNIINIRRVGVKEILSMAFVAILFIGYSAFMKQYRNNSIFEVQTHSQYFEIPSPYLSARLAERMSPEGVVNMTILADDYFSTHKHSFGTQTLFPLYAWIPRRVWPNKPLLIDYWLIREYDDSVPDAHSTASGFTGELRADFGMFSLFIVFLLGLLLSYMDSYVETYLSVYPQAPQTIIASMIYPAVFFGVRSPVLSLYIFITVYCFYWLLKKILRFDVLYK